MPPQDRLSIDHLGQLIYEIRGQRVMFDSDLASIYGVETKALNRAMKRNRYRFPKDFMFQLSEDEWKSLKYQIGTSSLGHGGRRSRPYVFTEHGAIMAANVLKSARRASRRNARVMKKVSNKSSCKQMRNEYDFSQGERGKYARRYTQGTNVVVLEPDV